MTAQDTTRVPHHVGIIIDGNRRWAKENGLPTLEGHRQGLEKVKEVGRWCWDRGVRILTIFAFSTENWNRSKAEVRYLMRLLGQALAKKEVKRLNKEGIKVRVIGQRERLPKSLQGAIKQAEELTENNKQGILNIALSYGGRAEITEAIRKIIREKVSEAEINESLVGQNLWTNGLPDPDLIIRTAGEQRLSNFLIWQAAYSELYFCQKYWPDFSEKDLDEALEDYGKRQRSFGR